MGEVVFETKMLGVVTLYNPDAQNAVDNIRRYIDDLDLLIVWDNSPLEAGLREQVLASLQQEKDKIVWQGDGQNHFIASAVSYALDYATQRCFDMLLIMDQDSCWEDFRSFRRMVESCLKDNPSRVFCPYIVGNDTFEKVEVVQQKNFFINSGTVIPVRLLQAIGGVDEAFQLDALDEDLSIRVRSAGYSIVCLTDHMLYHVIGTPQRRGPFNLYTPNYNASRTYIIAKSHVILYRKHRKRLSWAEKVFFLKEYFLIRFLVIFLAEPDKGERLKMFFKGIHDGCRYKLP